MLSKLNSLTGIAGAALVAFALTVHPAVAETGQEAMKVAFAYNPGDPAEKIYSHLQSVAREACAVHGSRSLRIDQFERTCARDLLGKAVAGIGRGDVARLHRANSAILAASDIVDTSAPRAVR